MRRGLGTDLAEYACPFNLVAPEFEVNAHDGRITVEYTAKFGIRIPANRTLEHPVISALAVQNI